MKNVLIVASFLLGTSLLAGDVNMNTVLGGNGKYVMGNISTSESNSLVVMLDTETGRVWNLTAVQGKTKEGKATTSLRMEPITFNGADGRIRLKPLNEAQLRDIEIKGSVYEDLAQEMRKRQIASKSKESIQNTSPVKQTEKIEKN